MTSSTFNVGNVHVGVEIDATGAKAKIEAALNRIKANVNVEATVTKLTVPKKLREVNLIGKVARLNVPDHLREVQLRGVLYQLTVPAHLKNIDVHARVTRVTQPVPPPRINVIGNIVGTTGGGGRGKDKDEGGFNFPPGSWIRALKGAGSGGFFEGITTAIAHLLELGQLPGKMLKGLSNLMGTLADNLGKAAINMTQFGEAAAGAHGIMAKLTGQSAQFAGMLAGAAEAAAGPVGIVVGVAVLVGVIAALGAGITLVSPLVFNLAGGVALLAGAAANAVAGLAVLAPLVAGLGVGLGVAALAGKDAAGAVGAFVKATMSGDPKDIEAYNEALKNLGPNARGAVKAFEPLVTAFTGIQDIAEQKMFEGMAAAIGKFKPVVDVVVAAIEGIAGAVGDVIDKFFELGADTTFVDSIKTLMDSVAPIVTNIGGALVNVFAGLTNFFALLSPLAVQFSEAIGELAQKFRDWTASAEGKTGITDFFTNAYNIMIKVFGIVGTIGKIFIALVSATQKPAGGEGRGFLDTINEKLQGWLDWINSNGGKIQKWFEQAIDFGKLIVEWVGKIIEKFASWNTEENQQMLENLVNAVGFFISYLMRAAEHMGGILQFVGGVISGIISIIRSLWEYAQIFFGGLVDLIGGLFSGVLNTVGGVLSDIWNAVKTVFALLLDLLLEPFLNFMIWLLGLPGEVGTIFSAVWDAMKAVWDAVLDFLKDPFGKFLDWMGAWIGFVGDVLEGIWSVITTVWTLILEILKKPFNQLVDWIGSFFGSLVGGALGAAWDVIKAGWDLLSKLKQPFLDFLDWVKGFPGMVKDLIGNIDITPTINLPSWLPGDQGEAAGRIVNGPSVRLVGEAGPEAIIPLTRPLSRVNPEVRAMAALIRGESAGRTATSAPAAGKTVNVTQYITPVQSDPRAVAMSVVNRLASAV